MWGPWLNKLTCFNIKYFEAGINIVTWTLMSLFLNRCISPGSNTQVGTIHGSLWYWSTGRANEELQEVLNSEMSIFHIIRNNLLGRYSTIMWRSCGKECDIYLLSTIWFLAAVRLSALLETQFWSRLFWNNFLGPSEDFWLTQSLFEFISEKAIQSLAKCWRLGCGEDPTSCPVSSQPV